MSRLLGSDGDRDPIRRKIASMLAAVYGLSACCFVFGVMPRYDVFVVGSRPATWASNLEVLKMSATSSFTFSFLAVFRRLNCEKLRHPVRATLCS